MLTNGAWAYAWDAENRLISACSNNVLLVSNIYDHQSRRIRKEVCERASPSFEFHVSRTHAFLYDGWNPVRETIQNLQSAITNYYTWGLDLSGTLQGAGGVGGLLAVTCVSSGTSNLLPLTYYPLFDANGNVIAYFTSEGSVAASFEYDAFGNTVSALSNLSTLELLNVPFRFSTKYLDPETGLYYYGYRYYHPELGRWVSRDPMAEREGGNLYNAINNNVMMFYDVLGMYVYEFERGFSSKEIADMVGSIERVKYRCNKLIAEFNKVIDELNKCPACYSGLLKELTKLRTVIEDMTKKISDPNKHLEVYKDDYGGDPEAFYNDAVFPRFRDDELHLDNSWGLKDPSAEDKIMFHEISHGQGTEDKKMNEEPFNNAHIISSLMCTDLEDWSYYGYAKNRSEQECNKK